MKRLKIKVVLGSSQDESSLEQAIRAALGDMGDVKDISVLNDGFIHSDGQVYDYDEAPEGYSAREVTSTFVDSGAGQDSLVVFALPEGQDVEIDMSHSETGITILGLDHLPEGVLIWSWQHEMKDGSWVFYNSEQSYRLNDWQRFTKRDLHS